MLCQYVNRTDGVKYLPVARPEHPPAVSKFDTFILRTLREFEREEEAGCEHQRQFTIPSIDITFFVKTGDTESKNVYSFRLYQKYSLSCEETI